LPNAVIESTPEAEGENNTINVFAGQVVELSCEKSSDPDGTIVSCNWYFEDMEGNNILSNSGLSQSYAAPEGVTVVTLEACDEQGACDSETVLINGVKQTPGGGDTPTIDNRAPIACFTIEPADRQGTPGTTEFVFDASCSNDPDSGDFITSYSWDLGDGTKSSNKVVRHIYADDGSDYKVYTVTLIVTDNGYDGTRQKLSALKEATVVVSKSIPSISLVAMPSEGQAPLGVIFRVLGEKQRKMFARYEWDFGDGSIESGTYEAMHTYVYPGEYTTKVTAVDVHGNVATGVTSIKLYEPKGIIALTADDVKLYETTNISISCVGTEEVSLAISAEESAIALAGIPCNTVLQYGPLLEPGVYTIEAAISGCSALECTKSTTFNVKREIPRIKTPEISPLLIIGLVLVVLTIVRKRRSNSE
jgi:PKD repeat protein